jgi:hypothetical protein
MNEGMVFPDKSFKPKTEAKLNVREYQRLAASIEEVCGIRIPPSKQILMESRSLGKRQQLLSQASGAPY